MVDCTPLGTMPVGSLAKSLFKKSIWKITRTAFKYLSASGVLSGCVPFDMMKRERILTKIFHKGKMLEKCRFKQEKRPLVENCQKILTYLTVQNFRALDLNLNEKSDKPPMNNKQLMGPGRFQMLTEEFFTTRFNDKTSVTKLWNFVFFERFWTMCL